MDLLQQRKLSDDTDFKSRVESAMVHAAIGATTEVANEVHNLHIAGGPTGGTFTLTYAGIATAPIAWNANAAAVQAALQAIAPIGNGNVQCTGGPLPGADVVITFSGTLGGQPLNLTTSTSSLTGGAPVITITRTAAGVSALNHTARAALAKLILTGPGNYMPQFAKAVADAAAVQADFDPVSLQLTATEAQAKIDINNQVSAVYNAFT